MPIHIFTSSLEGGGLKIGNINQKITGSALREIVEDVNIEGDTVQLNIDVSTIVSFAMEINEDAWIDTNSVVPPNGDNRVRMYKDEAQIFTNESGTPLFTSDVDYLFVSPVNPGPTGTRKLKITVLTDATP